MKRLEAPAKFSIDKAREIQKCLAQKIICEDRFQKSIDLVAGIDISYYGELAASAAVVLKYDTCEIVETQSATQRPRFPYVPTLFAFRELPHALAVIQKLKTKPDVFLVDGHGKAHPFGCGFASHLGVVIKKPTVGVAKSILVGDKKRIGEEVFLVYKGEIVGQAVYPINGLNPVYVSVGHLVSLSTAVSLVKHFSRYNRIPEPIRQAHMLALTKMKAKIVSAKN